MRLNHPVPFRFTPRPYQRTLWSHMLEGGTRSKRAVLVWHRRSGKDKNALNLLLWAAMVDRPGVYYYFFPTYGQAKRVLWDGIDGDGHKFLFHHVPPEMIVGKPNETELKFTLRNINGGESLVQLIGTDNMDFIVGSNPVGCVFSEYSIQHPRAWDLVRPILNENKGWAVFIFTPRGRNHGFKLFEAACGEPTWLVERLKVTDTAREDGLPIITADDIEQERRTGMEEDLIQQEYYCSFQGGASGSYFGSQLDQAHKDGRVTSVAWEPSVPVVTAWDIGIGDRNAIWFAQLVGAEVRLIDYLEAHGEGLPFYVRELKTRPYVYERYSHYAPHDIEVREYTTGRSRRETAETLGLYFTTVAKLAKDDQIDAARRLFHRCWFDKARCADGINALSNYRKEYDEKRAEYKRTPLHDWASHGADAFMNLSLGMRDPQAERANVPVIRAESEFSLFGARPPDEQVLVGAETPWWWSRRGGGTE